MNVVHLVSSGALGGAESVVLDILAGLRASRPAWHFLLLVPAEGSVQRRARELGVEVRVVPFGASLERLGDVHAGGRGLVRLLIRMVIAIPAGVAYLVRLHRVLASARASVVHAHGAKMLILAMWARPRRVPLVLHLHDYVRRRPIVSRLLRYRRGRVAGIAISRSIAEDLAGVLAPAVPIHVVHNGIDTTTWSPHGASLDLDAEAHLPPAPSGTVRVGLVATLARWKGHEVFLHALRILRARRVAVRGYVIGGPIYRTDGSQYDLTELRALAATLELDGEVGFTGYVADSPSAMRALDIVVHASTLPEPFGKVIVEGMATERPVISTALGGAAELIEPGVSALAVPPGDAMALADAIARLAADPLERRSLGSNGRRRVQRDFELGAMAAGVARIYEGLEGTPSPFTAAGRAA